MIAPRRCSRAFASPWGKTYLYTQGCTCLDAALEARLGDASDALRRVLTNAAAASSQSADATRDELRRVVASALSDAARPLEREARRAGAKLSEVEQTAASVRERRKRLVFLRMRRFSARGASFRRWVRQIMWMCVSKWSEMKATGVKRPVMSEAAKSPSRSLAAMLIGARRTS